MISSRLLYLALLIGRIALAYDFDWTLCGKESACFVGGGSHVALTMATTKPSKSCDVILSIRAYDASMKTLLVRVLMQGAGLDYEKGASLSVNSADKFGCVSKQGSVEVVTTMDSELISSSSDGTHLYCEFIVRHNEAILPQSSPQFVVKYSDAKTSSMPYQGFHTAIAGAITCDPDLIRFDNQMLGFDETIKKVPALRHTVSCGTDPLWELRIERPPGKLETVKSIACEQEAGKWAWKVTKRDESTTKVATFSAHCVTNSCSLCDATTPCSEAGCINPSFSPGTKANGVASCAQLSCPPDHVFAYGNKTAARVTCEALSRQRYRWMMEGAAVEGVRCVVPISPTTSAPPAARSGPDVNVTVVGVCGGVVALVVICVIIYCCMECRRRKKSGSREKMTSNVTMQEMHTGHAPYSDPDYSAKAQTPGQEGDTTKSPMMSPPNVTAKKESPGKKDKKKEEKISKTNWMIQKAKESIGFKKKATSVTNTNKSCKTKGKSQTDNGETEEETKKSKRVSAEGDTEKQSNERIYPDRPMKKYEPDHTPYESLINYEGVGDAPIKSAKEPKEPIERRKNTPVKQPGTEHSAKDRTETRPSQDDKPSLEPMRYPEGSEKGSAERDDRTQSGTERRKN